MIPGVHACYRRDDVFVNRCFVDYPRPDVAHGEMVKWKERPPDKVRCHDLPDELGLSWFPWNNMRWVDAIPPPKENGVGERQGG